MVSNKVYKLFAASGSVENKGTKQIHGKVNGITFTSNEFTGTMNGQKFWDDLRAYSNSIGRYVELVF